MAFLGGLAVFLFGLFLTRAEVALALSLGAGLLFRHIGKTQREAREKRKQELRGRVRLIVLSHLPALLRRKRQLDRTDEYGVRDDRKWMKEINHFCDNIVSPEIGLLPPEVPRGMKSQPRRFELDTLVAQIVEEAAAEGTLDFTRRFDATMSPTDYEYFCAERLKLSGWNPTVTQASGDQGADIVATRGKETLVVQCKHYSKPVGNKAVQEVVAAMRHYNGDVGVVIATNGFTKSAEQLAASNGVALLGHDDLTANWQPRPYAPR
jgi:restriction system protein